MLNKEDLKVLQRYKDAPKVLMGVLDSLSDEELDLTRGDGKWSIREIVHHIVECDLNYFQINRYALANTGKKYFFNEFDSHVWNYNMDHRKRPINLEVQLFCTVREYISYLCETIPNALDRSLIHQNGEATVRDALNHDITHAYHHIDQINETKRIHKI